MASSPPSTRAAGVFLAIGTIAGSLIGVHYGQPSAGLLLGLAAGCVVALALWLVDRARGRG